jgi:hypothetical protein
MLKIVRVDAPTTLGRSLAMSLERPFAKAFPLTPRDTDLPGASSNLQADPLGGKTTLTVSRPLDRPTSPGFDCFSLSLKAAGLWCSDPGPMLFQKSAQALH